MRYVVGFMMMAFFLAGGGLFAAGVLGLIRRLVARRRLRPAEGEIIWIDKRQETRGSDSDSTVEYHYPEIKFRPERGADQTFLSEIGAGARAARYAIGQTIAVLYDPNGKIPPMINSWAGVWGPHLVRTIVGPIFVFGALLIYLAFGERILGR
jgi:hypothetical protein